MRGPSASSYVLEVRLGVPLYPSLFTPATALAEGGGETADLRCCRLGRHEDGPQSKRRPDGLVIFEAGRDAPAVAELLDDVHAASPGRVNVREGGHGLQRRVVVHAEHHAERQLLEGEGDRGPGMHHRVGDELARNEADVLDQVGQLVIEEMPTDKVAGLGRAGGLRGKYSLAAPPHVRLHPFPLPVEVRLRVKVLMPPQGPDEGESNRAGRTVPIESAPTLRPWLLGTRTFNESTLSPT